MTLPSLNGIIELAGFLEEKYQEYNTPRFIESDPISIPHQFTVKQDIEISGFLAATIAWGQRPVIIRNANKLMSMMDFRPYYFIQNASDAELIPFQKFVHRTFQGEDIIYFLKALRHIYRKHKSMEDLFINGNSLKNGIIEFRNIFLDQDPPVRTKKHISNPAKGSAAKRINMFLRWMVRKEGVDFGIWNKIDPSQLHCPLDVHSGSVARKLGLLKRKQNDWKAVDELTGRLKTLCPDDPVKYDFALFGLGVFEGF